MREKKLYLEKNLLEGELNCNKAEDEYNICKENLSVIYDEIEDGIKIRNRCNWFDLAGLKINLSVEMSNAM